MYLRNSDYLNDSGKGKIEYNNHINNVSWLKKCNLSQFYLTLKEQVVSVE